MKFPNLPRDAVYFIGNDELQMSHRMYFDLTSAENSPYPYMDLFSKDGFKIKSYRCVGSHADGFCWTDEF